MSKIPKSFSKRALGTTSRSNAAALAAAATTKPTIYMEPGYDPKIEDNRPVVPAFWTGESAVPFSKFVIDCEKLNLHEVAKVYGEGKHKEVVVNEDHADTKALREVMKHTFEEIGAFQLTNTGLKDIDQMSEIAKMTNENVMWYEGGANLRGYIEKNVYDTGAPKEAHIHYHHEMAYVKESCKWISFICEHAPENTTRGRTFLAENGIATDELMATPFGEKLKNKGLCYIRKLPDRKYFVDNNLDDSIVYNYWQTSMGTEDMDEAVEVAAKMGLVCEWQESPIFGRYLVTKYYASAFEYDPFSDRNVLFASIADDYMWFDTWPGVMELPHWERPLKLNFGDDEVMTREEKKLFCHVYDKGGVPLNWKRGDIGVVCNFRFAHGRPAYHLENGEKRELGVVLGETFSRVGDLPNKWK